MLKTEELKLVSEWDKTFPKSEKVDHEKVTFVNRYGITLAADLYKPKNAFGKYPAIAVSGPFGAVKEQCSGLYAQTMAEKGYLTIGCMSFMNQPILKYSNEIRSAVLIVHGEKAHSYYFGKDAYENMIKDSKYTSNKELSARKAVVLENIEMEGLSEAELSMVKLESVREVLFQALLLDDPLYKSNC